MRRGKASSWRRKRAAAQLNEDKRPRVGEWLARERDTAQQERAEVAEKEALLQQALEKLETEKKNFRNQVHAYSVYRGPCPQGRSIIFEDGPMCRFIGHIG